MIAEKVQGGLPPVNLSNKTMIPIGQAANEVSQSLGILLTFKEAMNYLRVSRSTLYRLMWSGQLIGYKIGSSWRFYQADLRTCVQATPIQALVQPSGEAATDPLYAMVPNR